MQSAAEPVRQLPVPSLLPHNRASVHLGLGLIALCLLAFWGVWRNDFVDYDDNNYVLLNGHVRQGLTWETVVWAFTETHAYNWHPLTSLSHALDCQIFGLRPWGHHLTNLILHTANVLLLFTGLRRLTNALWRSALVAALFAVHPLHVESVAWVAERKDVLSGLFFMLTLSAYAKYAQRAQLGGRNSTNEATRPPASFRPSSSNSYLAALFFFALGLMSKPMLVTMPFVLLLLDFWPLHRIEFPIQQHQGEITRLLQEKVPFFVLSAISCLVTLLVQSEAMARTDAISLPARLGTAFLAYVAYIGQLLWPAKLAVFYPHPLHLQSALVVLSATAVVLTTIASLVVARRAPFFVTGWFWYIGMLVPVIGIVQVGSQARADRYTYLPSIGLILVVAWGLGALVAARPRLKTASIGVAAAGIAALALVANCQVVVWRNTHMLFEHAVRVTQNNYLALTIVAKEGLELGRIAETLTNAEQILKIAPHYPGAEYLLGSALQMQGKMHEAIPHLEASVGPEVAVPGRARLVISYIDTGRLQEAEQKLAELMSVARGPNAWLMRAALLKEQGRSAEALQLFNSLMAHNPKFQLDTPTMNFELAELYGLQGSNRPAVVYYAKALEISPQHTNALNNCAWILATDRDDQVRDGKRAVELAQRACGLSGWQQPVFMGTLAAAYAEAGRFDDAVKMADRARALAQTQGAQELAKRNSQLLELYREHKPYQEK